MSKKSKKKPCGLLDLNKCTADELATVLPIIQRHKAEAAAKAAAEVIPGEYLFDDVIVGRQRIARVWLFVQGGFPKSNLHGRLGFEIAAAAVDAHGFANLSQPEIMQRADADRRHSYKALDTLSSAGPFKRSKDKKGKWRYQFVFDAPNYPAPLNRRCRTTGDLLPEPPPHVRHLFEVGNRVSDVFSEVVRTLAGRTTTLSWTAEMTLLAIAHINPRNQPMRIEVADIQRHVPRDARKFVGKYTIGCGGGALDELVQAGLINRKPTRDGGYRGVDQITINLPAVMALRAIDQSTETQQTRPCQSVSEIGARKSHGDIMACRFPAPHIEQGTLQVRGGDDLSENSNTASAPPQAPVCAADEVALRPTEPGTTITTRSADAEFVAAKGLGAQEGDLHPASAHQACHVEPGGDGGDLEQGSDRTSVPRRQDRGINGSVGSGYRIDGLAGWSRHWVTVPGYTPPPAKQSTSAQTDQAAIAEPHHDTPTEATSPDPFQPATDDGPPAWEPVLPWTDADLLDDRWEREAA